MFSKVLQFFLQRTPGLKFTRSWKVIYIHSNLHSCVDPLKPRGVIPPQKNSEIQSDSINVV